MHVSVFYVPLYDPVLVTIEENRGWLLTASNLYLILVSPVTTLDSSEVGQFFGLSVFVSRGLFNLQLEILIDLLEI